jgi:IS5 family transposase
VFKKPRTYRVEARKRYLLFSKKKIRRRSEVRKAVGQQLRYLRRNLSSIDKLMQAYESTPLSARDAKYLDTIRRVYAHQLEMYRKRSHSVENRIVNIHQPYVRPIVRGKEKAKVEFGSKINVSLINGYSFIDHFSWDAFNEGSHLKESIDK